MNDVQTYVIEYDENGVAYLLDVDGRAPRIPLEHGALITVESYLPPAAPFTGHTAPGKKS